MNGVAERLQSVLRDEIPAFDVPVGLVPSAARRAVQVRRRRLATRGVLGIAGVGVVAAGANAVVDGLRDGRPARVTSFAGSSSPAPAAGQLRITVTRTACDAEHMSPRPGCVRTLLRLARPGKDGQDLAIAERYQPPESTHFSPPSRVVVRFVDGTQAHASARRESDNQWSFTVPLPPGAEIDTVTIVDSEGNAGMKVIDAWRYGEGGGQRTP